MLARFVVGEEDTALTLRARAPNVGRSGQTANSVASKNITMTDRSFLLRLCIIAVSSLNFSKYTCDLYRRTTWNGVLVSLRPQQRSAVTIRRTFPTLFPLQSR